MELSNIAKKNDLFRTTMTECDWAKALITRSVSEHDDCTEIVEAVRNFNIFNEDNDPHGEHD